MCITLNTHFKHVINFIRILGKYGNAQQNMKACCGRERQLVTSGFEGGQVFVGSKVDE